MVLLFRNDFGLIQTKGSGSEIKDGLSIAILNKLVFRGLHQILWSRSSLCDNKHCTRQHIVITEASHNKKEKYCGPIRHDVWISLDEWNKKLEEHRQLPRYSRKIVRMKADIVLFGPQLMQDDIAKELGGSQLFLQKPHDGSYSGHYDNPQSMNLPHLDSANLDATQLSIDSLEHQNDPQIRTRNESDLLLADFVLNIDQLFDQLPTHGYLMKVRIDQNKIPTPLLE
jgi:hypothetical protein